MEEYPKPKEIVAEIMRTEEKNMEGKRIYIEDEVLSKNELIKKYEISEKMLEEDILDGLKINKKGGISSVDFANFRRDVSKRSAKVRNFIVVQRFINAFNLDEFDLKKDQEIKIWHNGYLLLYYAGGGEKKDVEI